MSDILKFDVEAQYEGLRIDKFLSEFNENLSRSYIQKLIKDEKLTVNGKIVKANFKISEDDEILLIVPEVLPLDIKAENIPIDIIYEDDDIIIVNKPKGMVVHPAAGHYSGTLVNALLYHCSGLSGINGILRPGIVHRIDMNTTGVLVVCKNDKSHLFIAEQLKVHSITRKYEAIVFNNFQQLEGVIDEPIGRSINDRKKMAINQKNGKRAVTHYKVIENLGNKFAYIECTLETGRTHQIRVHMSSINHSLVGDDLYGKNKQTFGIQGQALHAKILGFIHPSTKKYVEFSAPLPKYFEELKSKCKNI